jgi:hypothetical protein
LTLRWEGAVGLFLAVVSRVVGISEASLLGRDRRRDLAQARRLAVLTWTRYLGRRLTEVSMALGISVPAAIGLVRRRPDQVESLAGVALEVADQCWALGGPSGARSVAGQEEVGLEPPHDRPTSGLAQTGSDCTKES